MSATVTQAPDYLRQRGFFNPAEHEYASYTQVGVGGIGSFAAFAVAKMGVPYVTLIDPDIVEAHNLPNQMFDTADADYHKVEAMAEQIERVAPACLVRPNIAAVYEHGWEPGDGAEFGQLQGVVGSGLDSMKARSDLWSTSIKYNPLVPLYIDGRLDGQSVVIYAVNPCDPEDIEQYERTLLDDDAVPAGVCTERNIIDVGFFVGAQFARAVRRYYTDQPVDKITVYDANTNTLHKGGWLPL